MMMIPFYITHSNNTQKQKDPKNHQCTVSNKHKQRNKHIHVYLCIYAYVYKERQKTVDTWELVIQKNRVRSRVVVLKERGRGIKVKGGALQISKESSKVFFFLSCKL